MVKKFKSFVKEKELKDFEEDVLGNSILGLNETLKRLRHI